MRSVPRLPSSAVRISEPASQSESVRDSARVCLSVSAMVRPLTKLFIVSSAFEAINASAKYLRCLGFFYWMLGILNVCRMVTQGLGYSGRAVFSGVMEMLARTIVCLGFVGAFGFTAICFADQAAWLAACCYIAPTCLYCVKKSTKMIADRGAK